MILRLLSRLTERPEPTLFEAAIAVPGRVYAIGDVHGSAGLLERLIARIAAECRADGVEAEVVLLGDYVDRGDAAREALEIVAALGEIPGFRPVLLMGNHEQMLLDFLDNGKEPARWLRHGGLQTLLSYGVRCTAVLSQERDVEAEEDLRSALIEAMGPHLALLRGLQVSHAIGNAFFSHAGADPDMPLDRQPDHALLWGSPGFLERPRSDGHWVVHGHYVVDAPTADQGRIAVDTGAYFSRCLTAARIEGGDLTFLRVADD